MDNTTTTLTLNKEQTIQTIHALKERAKSLSNINSKSIRLNSMIKACNDAANALINQLNNQYND